MRTNTRSIKGLVWASGLVVLSMATTGRGQDGNPYGNDASLDPQFDQLAGGAGGQVVDEGSYAAYPVYDSGPVYELSGNRFANWRNIQRINREAKRNSYSYVSDHEGPYIVGEGPEYRMTGNPIIDLYRNATMRVNGESRRWYHQWRANNPRTTADERWRAMKCRWGYFFPTGCCGGGCPLMGSYHMVYAVNPSHFDPRDGRVYSAPGYGTPMAVPLAPNVEKTYNYGWGIPSSRLTPVSRRIPERHVNRGR